MSTSSLMKAGLKTATINYGKDFYNSRVPGIYPNGVTLKATYFDNVDIVGDKAPVAIVNHGVPSDYRCFKKLITQLNEKGYRVVGPNYPSLSNKLGHKYYQHTVDERMMILKEICKETNVDRVSLAVGHSFGTFIPPKMYFDPYFKEVKNIAIFNPITRMQISRAYLVPLGQRISEKYLYQHEFLTKLSIWLMCAASLNPTVFGQFADPTERIISLARCEKLKCSESMRDIVKEGKTNVMVVQALNDIFYTKKGMKNLVEFYGFNFDDRIIVDKKGRVSSNLVKNPKQVLINTVSGNHFSYHQYANAINDNLFKMMHGYPVNRVEQEDFQNIPIPV